MWFNPDAEQNRPQSFPVSRQDGQWLAQLQHHVADLASTKRLIPEKKHELEDRQKRLSQMARNLGEIQDQLQGFTWSRNSLNNHGQKLRDEMNSLITKRKNAVEEYKVQEIEYKRLNREVVEHQNTIKYLMERLKIVVS